MHDGERSVRRHALTRTQDAVHAVHGAARENQDAISCRRVLRYPDE